MGRQAKADVPRWKRRTAAPAGSVVVLKGRQARAYAAQQSAARAASGTPAGPQPPAGLLARTGAYRLRRHLIPVGLLLAILAIGLTCHVAHSGKATGVGVTLGVLGAAGLFALTRHLKAFGRRSGVAMAALVATWVPVLTLAGTGRPWLFLLFASWLCLMWPWAKHYRWRPDAEPPAPHLDDKAIWEQRIASKRLKGTWLAEPAQIPGGRRWTVMLPHGDLVPSDVLAIESRIAGAWDKPRTEVFVEPYPDGRESRAVLTILKRDNLRDVTEWDGSGIDPVTGTAAIGRFADGQPARIRFFARRGLIAGTTGAGKTYLLDLIVRIALTSGYIVPVILDPQEGQSLPYWRKRVLYASGADECMAMLRGLQAGMLDRSRHLSTVRWTDEEGHAEEGMDFYDPYMTDRKIVLVIGDEFPVLLTDPKYGAEAVRITADLGKRGRKTGVSLWPVAQVPSLSELGDQVVRSMLVGGNVVCLRTGDRVSAGMLGLDVDPSSLPRYFADGSPTYGLGYVFGPELRQAVARTHIVPRAMRREVPAIPQLDDRFAAAMDKAMSWGGTQLAMPAAPLAAVPQAEGKPSGSAADAVLAVLEREMTRGEVIAALDGAYSIRAVGDVLKKLTDAEQITKTGWGSYAPVRATLHVVPESATSGPEASAG